MIHNTCAEGSFGDVREDVADFIANIAPERRTNLI